MKVNAEGVVLWKLELLEASHLRPTNGLWIGAPITPFRGGDLDIKKDDDDVMWVGSQRDKNGVTLKRFSRDGEIIQRLRARDFWEQGVNHNSNAPGTTSCTQLRIDRHGNLYCLPLNTQFKRMVGGSPSAFNGGPHSLKYVNPTTGEILWYGTPHTASDGTVYGYKGDAVPTFGTEWGQKFPFGLNDQIAAQSTMAFEYDWNEDQIFASCFSGTLSATNAPWSGYLSKPWMLRYKLTDYVDSARYWYPVSRPNMVIDCPSVPSEFFNTTYSAVNQAKWFFHIPFEVPLSTTIPTSNPNSITENVWWIHLCTGGSIPCGYVGGYSGQIPRGIVVDGASTVLLACYGAQTHEINPTFSFSYEWYWGQWYCNTTKADQFAPGYWMKCLAFDLLGGTAEVNFPTFCGRG